MEYGVQMLESYANKLYERLEDTMYELWGDDIYESQSDYDRIDNAADKSLDFANYIWAWRGLL